MKSISSLVQLAGGTANLVKTAFEFLRTSSVRDLIRLTKLVLPFELKANSFSFVDYQIWRESKANKRRIEAIFDVRETSRRRSTEMSIRQVSLDAITSELTHKTGDALLTKQPLEYLLVFTDKPLAVNNKVLALVSLWLARNLDVKFAYFDGETYEPLTGTFHSPRFKPEFNSILQMSTGYAGDTLLIERQHFEELLVGTASSSQLTAVTLPLLSERLGIRPKRISVPIGANLASPAGLDVKASIELLNTFFQEPGAFLGYLAKQNPLDENSVRVIAPPAVGLVSIIIPTRDRVELLRACIESIKKTADSSDYELIVIDNNSLEQETLAYFKELSSMGARIIHDPSEFNYSKLNNSAAKIAQGEFLCFVNNDIVFEDTGWLEEMRRWSAVKDIGCVGTRLKFPNDTIQHAGVSLGLGGIAGHRERFAPAQEAGYLGMVLNAHYTSAVTGACLMIAKAKFESVGGFDERLKVALNDVDLCIAVREAGYNNLYTPFVEITHFESLSRGLDVAPKQRARAATEVTYMLAKWGQLFNKDPLVNPNLTLSTESIRISSQPRFFM